MARPNRKRSTDVTAHFRTDSRSTASRATARVTTPGIATGAERRAEMTDDVDSILDEIDEVLESNAEEFVKAYVQKGGE